MSTIIEQQIVLPASSEQVFTSLLTQTIFAQITGTEAEITAEEGAAFCLFSGWITGRNIEIIKNERIVQAWRVKDWPEGVFSLIAFNLKETNEGQTQIDFEHKGYPIEKHDHLSTGWETKYWQPLKEYFQSA